MVAPTDLVAALGAGDVTDATCDLPSSLVVLLKKCLFFVSFGFGCLVEGPNIFEALWSGRMALCSKGASLALPGERREMLERRPLRRYLGEFSPCIGIKILWFQPCLRDY